MNQTEKRKLYFKKYYQEHKQYFKDLNQTEQKKDYYRNYYKQHKNKYIVKKPINNILITHEPIIVYFN